ncbi:hypothetical protein HELRODRAFT_162634 [Helobdella robusta]|uniref:Endonuclease/exonuclease/phosphatase domain-containing protein n=1 Tax=Helobdella robusta TaxID=6412 RepID=T1ESY3_HELRO|nr:hypothetical protein HELRODRAFT_162634 [Helobdella robusta]ESN99139.1 hypothetical protein HELRODRAFT_162634 [Helobdella robusta]
MFRGKKVGVRLPNVLSVSTLRMRTVFQSLKKFATFWIPVPTSDGSVIDAQAALEINKEKLNQLESTDVFRGELNILKNDMKVSFADIVSRGIKGHADDIKAEVKTVQTTINDAKQIKERENNPIMFHLPEILKHLSNNVVDANLVHLTRRGKKSDDHTRPLFLKMDSVDIKNMIIKNVSKLKSLDVSLGRIGLSHDLSPGQRKELRSKIEEARALETSDKGFLYRVRGQILTLGVIGNDYLDSSLDGNKCLMMKGTGNDLNGNVNFGCLVDGHGLDGGDYSMVCGTGSDLNVIGKNGCGKDDGSDCVITNGTGNDRNKSGGFNDLKKVGNNNVMKGGAVGRNIGGIKNDRTNNNFCVVKIKLGLLNIRSIGSKYNIIYDLISDGLDIFVVTESWHGSSENPSIALSTPPGYRFVDCVRDHDPLHVLSSRIILTGDFNVHVEKTNDPYAANLNDIFDNFPLINHIKAPTHLLGGTLDLIVASEDFPVHDCLAHPKLSPKKLKSAKLDVAKLGDKKSKNHFVICWMQHWLTTVYGVASNVSSFRQNAHKEWFDDQDKEARRLIAIMRAAQEHRRKENILF